MHDYLEMEYEEIVKELYNSSDDELFEEYYLLEEENYSFSPSWSNHDYYVEYWDSK